MVFLLFIAFEGIDGSGKSKQAAILYRRLKKEGGRTLLTNEPTDGPIGTIIRKVLEKEDNFDPYSLQLLFAADRAYHIGTVIAPAVENDTTVVTDRYIYSTIAYGSAAGLDRKWLVEVNSRFVKPDITFVMDIDPEIAIKRVRRRALEFIRQSIKYGYNDIEMDKRNAVDTTELFEKVDFLAKVRKIYRELSKSNSNCHIVDANREVEDISEEIMRILERYRGSHRLARPRT